jgi:hypothetical protein
MATEDIKVVSILQDSLQRVNENNKYVLRFRVSNEDGSQKSSWSPYLDIDAKKIPAVLPITTSQMTASIDGSVISLQWTPTASSYRPLYDIFVRWSTDGTTYGAYEFLDTVSVSSATVFKLTGTNRIKFRVQVAGLVTEENNNLLLGESNGFTI